MVKLSVVTEEDISTPSMSHRTLTKSSSRSLASAVSAVEPPEQSTCAGVVMLTSGGWSSALPSLGCSSVSRTVIVDCV